MTTMRVTWLVALAVSTAVRAEAKAGATRGCATVAACVALAGKTPDEFTPMLTDRLEELPARELVAGLAWKHKKPLVTDRVMRLVRGALIGARGHTPGSAERLLALVRAEKSRELQQRWLGALGRDPAGRALLVRLLDDAAPDPFRLRVAIPYIETAGWVPFDVEKYLQLQGASTRWVASIPVVIPAEERPRIAALAEFVWQQYLPLRTVADEAEEGAWERSEVRAHVRDRAEYDDKVIALVRATVADGRVPDNFEFGAFAARTSRRPEVARDLLTWMESSSPDLRVGAGHDILLQIDEAGFDVAEKIRLRRALVRLAEDPAYSSRSSVPYFLRALLDGVTEEEAVVIERLALTLPKPSPDHGLLALLADRLPPRRGVVFARSLGAHLDEVPRMLSLDSSHEWLNTAVVEWLTSRTDDALRDEAVQERFIVLAEVTRRRIRRSIEIPQSRRERTEENEYLCYSGPMMARTAAVENRDDRAAFGLAPPEKTPEQQVPEAGRPGHFKEEKLPASPPMTAPETTARWQAFIAAREAIRQQATRK